MNGAVQVPDRTLAWLYSALERNYQDVQRTYSDIARTLSYFPFLSPRTDVYNHENGASALLLLLHGNLPVAFKGATYRTPIILWFPQDFPRVAPISYVSPRPGLSVRPGQHVSVDGRIYHPYLANWSSQADRSSVVDFLNILQGVFAKEPPVVANAHQDRAVQRGHDHEPAGIRSPNSQGSTPSAGTISASLPQQPIPPPPPPKPPETHGNLDGRGVQDLDRHANSSTAPPLPPKPGQPGDAQRTGLSNGVASHFSPRDESRIPHWRYSQPPPLPSEAGQARRDSVPFTHQSLGTYAHGPPVGTFSNVAHAQPQSSPSTAMQTSISSHVPWQSRHHRQPMPQSLQRAPERRADVDLMSTPLENAQLSQTSTPPSVAPPIPPNPEKDAILHAISTAFRTRLEQTISQNDAALPALQAQHAAMQQAYHKMQTEKYQLEELGRMLGSNEKILRNSMKEADRVMETAGKRQVPAIDDVLVAPTIVGEQLYGLVAEERGIADALFMLTRALDKGRIGCDVFVKQTRSLAREQFLKKALIKRVAQGMGLNI